MNHQLQPLGRVHSCYKEKFGVPRQPGLVPARGTVELLPPFNQADSVRGLEAFSHIWIIWEFSENTAEGWTPLVRPPRLGGNEKRGVFASRSPFRPNALGMSAVKLEKVLVEGSRVSLHISGHDLVDGTPVYDIKPYLPYADSIPDARGGFAPQAPENLMAVQFTDAVEPVLAEKEKSIPELREVITGVLAQDPRPAYRGDEEPGRIYGVKLFDLNIRWQVEGKIANVVEISTHP